MLIVASLIVMLNIFLSVVGLVSRHQRTDWEKKQIVYLPFYLAWIGIVCGTVFCVPTVACAMDGEWMFAFFGATVLVCDCMIAAYINCVASSKGASIRKWSGFVQEKIAKSIFGDARYSSMKLVAVATSL